MKHLISTTASIAAICMLPTLAAANSYNSGLTAHEKCKQSEDNRQILGGLAGAVAGGVFGSQVSGNGARTEGSAIGAVIGGLAGAGIADKSIDCDPVYDTSSSGYAPASTSQYGSTNYGSSTSYNTAPSHSSTSTYGSSGYSGSQPYYEDRVTTSNHPVYSDPYYGAGAVSQGYTNSAGTVTYPPSGNNSQYASSTYSAPSYGAPAPTTRQYVPLPVTTTRQYVSTPVATSRSYVQAPAAHRVVYTAPVRTGYVQHRPHRTQRRSHYHGRYSCDMGH